jgi:hypothetical protein
MSKTRFVAFLYVIGIAFTFLGLAEIYLRVEFALFGQDAVMTSTDPSVERVARVTPGQSMMANVILTTNSGEVVPVRNKRLSAKHVERLANGESIPVRFVMRDPEMARADGAKPPLDNLGWFIFGLIALAVATFAHQLMRRESAAEAAVD